MAVGEEGLSLQDEVLVAGGGGGFGSTVLSFAVQFFRRSKDKGPAAVHEAPAPVPEEGMGEVSEEEAVRALEEERSAVRSEPVVDAEGFETHRVEGSPRHEMEEVYTTNVAEDMKHVLVDTEVEELPEAQHAERVAGHTVVGEKERRAGVIEEMQKPKQAVKGKFETARVEKARAVEHTIVGEQERRVGVMEEMTKPQQAVFMEAKKAVESSAKGGGVVGMILDFLSELVAAVIGGRKGSKDAELEGGEGGGKKGLKDKVVEKLAGMANQRAPGFVDSVREERDRLENGHAEEVGDTEPENAGVTADLGGEGVEDVNKVGSPGSARGGAPSSGGEKAKGG